MRIKKHQTISLYSIPPEVVTGDSICNPSYVSIPQGLLPRIITRAESDVNGTVAELFKWFQQNLNERDGYIPASAALPALWLDADMYDEAVSALAKAIKDYRTVQGPVFVGTGMGRDAKFCVADWYALMQHGSTLTPVVTFKQSVPDSGAVVPNLSTVDGHVQHSNHMVGAETVVEEDDR